MIMVLQVGFRAKAFVMLGGHLLKPRSTYPMNFAKGPRTQIIGFQGPNTPIFNGIWTLKPDYLGTWADNLKISCANMRTLFLNPGNGLCGSCKVQDFSDSAG